MRMIYMRENLQDPDGQFAAALAACRGNWRNLALPDEVLARVGEIRIPAGLQIDPSFRNEDALVVTRKMKSLRRITVETGADIPAFYFTGVEKLDVLEIPIDAFRTQTEPLFGGTCTSVDELRIAPPRKGRESLPPGMVTINCFDRLGVRKAVILPGVTKVPEGAFMRCNMLESVELPDTVYYIGRMAFSSSALKSVSIPAGAAVGESAFWAAKKLERVEFRGRAEIGKSAFSMCDNLLDLDLPQEIELHGDNAFSMTGLRHAYVDCELVPMNTFASCGLLKRVEFGENVRDIQAGAFMNCVNLKTVSIPACIDRNMGKNAFQNCVRLETVRIASPAAIGMARQRYFNGCSGVKLVYADFDQSQCSAEMTDSYLLLCRLGFSETQTGSPRSPGSTKVLYRNQPVAAAGAKLTDAGYVTRTAYDGTWLFVDFGAGGIDVEKADAVQEALSLVGGANVAFCDSDGMMLSDVNDLSQIKQAIISFGDAT